MRELVNWKDHVVQYPGRFEEQVLGGGLVQHTPSPGKCRTTGNSTECYEFEHDGSGSVGGYADGIGKQ